VFNLGTGQEIRIGEIAERIAQKVGKSVKIEVDAHRLRPGKSEVLRLISDNRLAREKLGWSPQVSLDEGLERTIEWIRQHLDLFRPGRYEF
jgi:nucleoside-diphosphate-sugar epimerase